MPPHPLQPFHHQPTFPVSCRLLGLSVSVVSFPDRRIIFSKMSAVFVLWRSGNSVFWCSDHLKADKLRLKKKHTHTKKCVVNGSLISLNICYNILNSMTDKCERISICSRIWAWALLGLASPPNLEALLCRTTQAVHVVPSAELPRCLFKMESHLHQRRIQFFE